MGYGVWGIEVGGRRDHDRRINRHFLIKRPVLPERVHVKQDRGKMRICQNNVSEEASGFKKIAILGDF